MVHDGNFIALNMQNLYRIIREMHYTLICSTSIRLHVLIHTQSECMCPKTNVVCPQTLNTGLAGRLSKHSNETMC